MLNLLILGENIAKPENQAVRHITGGLPVKGESFQVCFGHKTLVWKIKLYSNKVLLL